MRAVLNVLRQKFSNVSSAGDVQQEQACEEDIRKLESSLRPWSGQALEQLSLQRLFLLMCDRDGYISACLQEAFLESLLKDHELQILLNDVMALRGSTPMHAPRSATIVNRGTAVSMPGQPAGRLRSTAATAEATSAAALGTSTQQSDTGSCR